LCVKYRNIDLSLCIHARIHLTQSIYLGFLLPDFLVNREYDGKGDTGKTHVD
jgi:hypothetical protein